MSAHSNLVGIKVKLDRKQQCCNGTCIIRPGQGPHAALVCDGCGAHCGWLSQSALNFITETTRRFGAPSEPIVLRQQEKAMAYELKDNTGSMFANDRKTEDTHPDRTGTAKIDGVEYWVNGWLRKTKKGQPYLSLSFKPKNADNANPKNSVAEDIHDQVPF